MPTDEQMGLPQGSQSTTMLLQGLLTILFVALKLTNSIDWSWWWVLSPLWIPFALGLVVVMVALALSSK